MTTSKLTFSDTANLPTPYGEFKIISFKQEGDSHEHCLLYMGDVFDKENVLTRVHSECLTGDVFQSKKCDCGEQLDKSMQAIAQRKEGVIIYLRQEGRGIGLYNKINAYALQDRGQDTIQANHSLGFETDLRDFTIATKALEHLQIKSIELLTNNPDKIEILEKSGIDIVKREALLIQPNAYNQDYLSVKKEQLNHML